MNIYGFLNKSVTSGSSISDVESSIRMMKECNFIIEKNRSKIFLNHIDENCNLKEMYAYPIRFILFQLFTSFYQQNEKFFTSEMVNLKGSTTSLDHTFKVSSNVVLFHLNKWLIQYNSLILILNECEQVLPWQLTRATSSKEVSGQVLAWQLTKGTSFKQVYKKKV